MPELLGQKLLKEKAVTKKELQKAVERQRIHGGRLGSNLIALGYITEVELKTLFRRIPKVPGSVTETGLDLPFIKDLIMKHILFMGDFGLQELSARIKLPVQILDDGLEELRREKFVEVKGAAGYAKVTYTFSVTGQGHNRAADLFDISRYAGPAPVPLEEYIGMVEIQTVKQIVVSEESVIEAFRHLIISDKQLMRIGPAISSGKAIFFYGPPGNGKTAIAETIGKVLPETVYMPYSIIVGGQVISIFDSVNHVPVITGQKGDTNDGRWLLIRRPVIMTGGELTLRMLDLDFNPISKYYEAPLQMKANNGIFIVDDFGRQQIEPRSLLNRWIVPLERKTDFMTLHTGMKFEIPFDQIVIFSTNIEPAKLVDEAFLRRIRYKIKIDHPSVEEYRRIFMKVCESNGIEFRSDVLNYLLKNYYGRLGVKLNACHPRDLMEHIIDKAHYYNRAPELTRQNIEDAWEQYFVAM